VVERRQQKGLTAWGWVLRTAGLGVWLWGGFVTPIQNGESPDFGTLLVAVVLAILPNASRLAERLMSQLPGNRPTDDDESSRSA
jgi:hypothetical protein